MNKNMFQEIKNCYISLLRTNKKLNLYVFIQFFLILISRSTVALSTLAFTYFVNKQLNIDILGSITIGVIFFYCINQVADLLFSIIQIRFYSNKILPISLQFIDDVIEKALLNYSQLKLNKSPVELSVLLNKKTETRNFLGYLLNHMLNPVLELIVCTVLLVNIGFGFLGFLLIPACLIYFTVSIFLLPFIKKQMSKIVDISAKQNLAFSLALNKTGIANVFGTSKLLARHLSEITQNETQEYKKQLIIKDVAYVFLNVPLVIFSCSFFYFGSQMVLNGEASYGAFAGFISVILTSFSQFKNLTFAFDGLNQSLSSLSFPVEIFNKCLEIKNKKTLKKDVIVDSLELKNYSPSYLKDYKFPINIKIEKNEKIFIMGDSGIGKSSILKGLLGHIEYSGDILINGKNIDRNSLLFSWMPQESNNMEGSIRFNLLLGNETASEEDMYNVLEKVKLKEKVVNIGGLDAILEYQGINFSGGEKQRLSLARALLSENPILLLDEPSSSMDVALENEIYKIINDIDKMTLIIAHHIYAIPDDGKIFYMTKNNGCYFITKENMLLKK